MDLFVTRPNHDDVTSFISEWFSIIISDCKTKGIKVIDLDGERANRLQVISVLEKTSPRLVVFNGHGSEETIMGYKDEILIKSNSNEEILKQKIVYSLSCNSAAKLGIDCVTAGTSAFIGYKLPFVLLSDPHKGFSPLDDLFLKPILEPSNEIVTTLLKGNTAKEAYNRSQALSNKWIDRFKKSDVTPEEQQLLPVLYWNKTAQTILGDEEARANITLK